jgi:signal transduction histidine kinase
MHEIIEELKGLAKDITLLYVEDNTELRIEVSEIFLPFFKNIIVAIDGEDGLQKYNNNNIDLVISDIYMPKMNGLEMSEEIRRENKEIPIVLFSAYEDSRYLMKAIDLSIEGFLPKPIDFLKSFQILIKILKNFNMKKELESYHQNLEEKVAKQVNQLRQKDELILKNTKLAAMGEMIDIIAHQWKQPLSLIAMQSDFLVVMNETKESIPLAELVNCKNKVNEQVTHLTATLDEFRTFFRPTIHKENINLFELFNSLKILLKDSIIKYNIILTKDFNNDITFSGNKNELKHLFINLINNAKDAFIQNNIHDRYIIIRAKEYEDYLTIQVEDNAGGIPTDILGKVFEANFTTKIDAGGTGIGLYMCKMITSKHQAEISVENKKNGVIFTINMPKD